MLLGRWIYVLALRDSRQKLKCPFPKYLHLQFGETHFQSDTNMDLRLWSSIPSLGRYIKSRLWKRWWEWHFTMRNEEFQRSGRGSWMTIEIVGFLLSSFSFIRYLFIPSGITYPIHSSVLNTAKTEQKWTEYDYFVANTVIHLLMIHWNWEIGFTKFGHNLSLQKLHENLR